MNDATESQLMRAYELIEAGSLEEARSILSPILAANRNNPDAWWIFSHAVTDPLTAKDALDHVLRLDPDYPGARELHDQVIEQIGAKTGEFATSPKPISGAPQRVTPISDEPDITSLEDEDDDDEGINLPRILLIAAIFILIAVVGILLANQSQQTAEPTAVAAATSTLPSIAPQAVITTEATEDASSGVTADSVAFAGLPVRATDTITVEGDTAYLNACGSIANVSALRPLVEQLKPAVAQSLDQFPADAAMIGIRVLDCTSGTPFVQISAPREAVESYANGGLTEGEYSARWRASGS